MRAVRLLLAFSLGVLATAAADARPLALSTHFADEQTAAVSASHARPQARINYVGLHEDATMLSRAISELLAEHDIDVTIEQHAELSESELVAAESAALPQRITAWLLMTNQKRVRFIFADPKLERYLLRELPLPNGLDAFGRETIAQVAESSILSLVEGTLEQNSTIERNALSRLLERSSTSEASSNPSRTVELVSPNDDSHNRTPAVPKVEHPSKAFPPSTRLGFLFGASYGLAWSGKDLGLEHGPGIALGIERRCDAAALFGTILFEPRFSQRFDTPELEATVLHQRVWLQFGYRGHFARNWSYVFALGPGLDLSRLHVRSQSEYASPSSLPVHTTLSGRAVIGTEWSTSSFIVQLLMGPQLSFRRTHYDVMTAQDNNPKPVATPWRAQPCATLGFLFH